MKSFLALVLTCQTAFCADYLTGQAARLIIGQQNFTALLSQQPPTATVLGGAAGVAYANNTLFIADSNKISAFPSNNRVLVYTPVSNFPGPLNPASPVSVGVYCPVCIGIPSTVIGQPDFVSYAQNLTQNGLRAATAVATDGTILVVADTDNNRVLIWKTIPTTNGQPADIVVGQADFTHGNAAASASATSLRGPQGVWIQNGKLIVTDTFDSRVLIYNTIPTANGAAADVVVGAADFTTVAVPPITEQTVPPTQTNLQSPVSATSDGTRLFVSDLGHNRVLIWNSIPTSNNQPADVVIGQPDFVSQVSNNSTVLCPSNGTDTTTTPATPTYPLMCRKTLSFPRFVLFDGTHLYIADGGNDRVLVYNSIPTANAAGADFILGEPDENTDSSSSNTDSMAAPSSLAWDGSNLYVADTFNNRVLVYTPLGEQLPLTAVRNSASLEVYATGSVTFTGTPATGDTVTVTIGTTAYTYTVQKNDTLANVVTGLVQKLNGTASGTTADPNVIALGDVTNPSIILTARVGGTAGEGTALAATVSSSSAIVATASGSTITINLADASEIAPGTLITIYGVNLAPQPMAADMTKPQLPRTLGGTTVFVDGIQAPLLYVSPTQVNAQMPYEIQDRDSVSVYVTGINPYGSPFATNAIGSVIVAANAGIFAQPGNDPRPGFVYHFGANATGLISIDGTIKAGDIATINVCPTACGTTTTLPTGSRTYTYTVLAADTLTTVTAALVKEINADPQVSATASNINTRIFLQARTPGTAGNGIGYSVSTNTGADLLLTAFTGSLCCSNAGGVVTTENPAEAGEVVYVYATGLGETKPSNDSVSGQVVTGTVNPLLTPVDSIVAGGKTGNIISAFLQQGTVGIYQVLFELDSGLPTDPLTQLTIAQQLFVSNVVTFPVVVQ